MAVALAVAFPSAVCAQQAPPENVSLFGKRYDAFRSMFAQKSLSLGTLAEFEQIQGDDARRWIVVALGDVSKLPTPLGGWTRFVRRGGALLVASDHGGAPAGAEFNVIFHPQPVLAPPDVECYPADQRDCPLVTDFKEGSPLFENLEMIALNRSGYLDVLGGFPEWTSATLPRGPTDATGRNVGGKPVIYGAAEGDGRFLFVADHSIYINETMLNQDDDVLNAPFAVNTVSWLINTRDAAELKVLFLEDGRPIDEWIDPRYVSGDWPTSTMQEKLQTLDKLLRAIDRMILEQQARRDPQTGLTLYNQSIRNWESQRPPGAFLRAALWGLAAFVLMATLGWLLGRRAPPPERVAAAQSDKPAAPPPYGPKMEDDPTHRSLLDRRRIEMLEEGHYVDLARRLSRVWLTQQLGAPPSGPPTEPFVIKGTSPRLRERWREAWRLATESDHPAMTLPQFQRFRADLASIQQALDRSRPVRRSRSGAKENA